MGGLWAYLAMIVFFIFLAVVGISLIIIGITGKWKAGWVTIILPIFIPYFDQAFNVFICFLSAVFMSPIILIGNRLRQQLSIKYRIVLGCIGIVTAISGICLIF